MTARDKRPDPATRIDDSNVQRKTRKACWLSCKARTSFRPLSFKVLTPRVPFPVTKSGVHVHMGARARGAHTAKDRSVRLAPAR
jgi:hypothetical protein